ncbi:MAG: hypothetical protein JWO06_1021 [Bacteroidota bacterium]|nr:hypothetical protein [Bacteroidota bacterium]
MANLRDIFFRFRTLNKNNKEYVYFTKTVGDSYINQARRVLTSTITFIVAFILSNVFLQSLIIIFSKSFKYKLKITYSHIEVLPHDIHFWSLARVIVIYFIPTMFCLVLGLMIFNLLVSNTNTVNRGRLFFFWFGMCLINIFLSHLLFAPFGIGARSVAYYQAFAIVGSWVGFNPAAMGVFAIGAIFIGILWGVVTSKEVLRFSFSSKYAATLSGKNSIIFQIAFLPVILGFIPCMLLCNITYIPAMAFAFLSMILVAFGMFVRNTNDWSIVRCNKNDVLNLIPVTEIVVLLFLWITVYQFFR